MMLSIFESKSEANESLSILHNDNSSSLFKNLWVKTKLQVPVNLWSFPMNSVVLWYSTNTAKNS